MNLPDVARTAILTLICRTVESEKKEPLINDPMAILCLEKLMTEAELLMFATEAIDRLWSLMQWWASISFGLLVVAHIDSSRIGAYLAVLVPLLYTCFSFFSNI